MKNIPHLYIVGHITIIGPVCDKELHFLELNLRGSWSNVLVGTHVGRWSGGYTWQTCSADAISGHTAHCLLKIPANDKRPQTSQQESQQFYYNANNQALQSVLLQKEQIQEKLEGKNKSLLKQSQQQYRSS